MSNSIDRGVADLPTQTGSWYFKSDNGDRTELDLVNRVYWLGFGLSCPYHTLRPRQISHPPQKYYPVSFPPTDFLVFTQPSRVTYLSA